MCHPIELWELYKIDLLLLSRWTLSFAVKADPNFFFRKAGKFGPRKSKFFSFPDIEKIIKGKVVEGTELDRTPFRPFRYDER